MTEIAPFRPRQLPADPPVQEAIPHSIEAEQQILGAILTNNDIFDRVASVIGRSTSTTPSTPASGRWPPRASRRTPSPRP
jgi:hypothetical protein